MSEQTGLRAGLVGRAETVVTPDKTARAVGSGTADVFATPMMIALMEAAAVDCVAGHLAAGETSLGTHVDVSHRAATPAGAVVSATAELVEIDGRNLVFRLEARDGHGPIGDGRHRRAVVDEERFMLKVNAKR